MPVLTKFIQDVYVNYPQIKFVGGCYGHQLLAHALGGKVGRMTSKEIPVNRRELITPVGGALYEQPWV